MSYKDYIKEKEKQYIGKEVYYEGKKYTIVKVDYNGMLHINKRGQYTDTMAVGSYINIKGEIK